MLKLQAIDDSNRSAHYYLSPEDECYFFHEFTARKGYAFSEGNQFIFNFKKSPSKRLEPQYQFKLQAIAHATAWYRSIFDQFPSVYSDCTFVPVPPSKTPKHPEYDDRVWQLVQGICHGKGADCRELISQTADYDAAHLAGDSGSRIKPHQLQALYEIDPRPPKKSIFLFDDVLSAGCHFKAAKAAILAIYPDVSVKGFFLARRVPPSPFEDFAM